MRPNRGGFTLIELMIVVAIIGILATIAIPKFASLIRKSNEGSTKGNLGAIRSAISIYYGDMEGQYPTSPTALTIGGKYLASVPVAKAPDYHVESSAVDVLPGGCVIVNWDINEFASGGWVYCDAPADAGYGGIIVNCTHTDTKGSVWSTY